MTTPYITDEATGDGWTMLLGDSCERLAELSDDSVDMSCYSPPFAGLFIYSATPRDIGNSAGHDEFLAHYRFVIREMFRVTKPGRMSCVHAAEVATTKATHGETGLYDLPGDIIRAHVEAGWTFYGRWYVDKDPQALRHGQRVLTPTGWTPIEAISVGDQVIGADGTATKVDGVWPQGPGQIYRVTFSDGGTVDCDAAHRWTVRTYSDVRNDRWRTLRTDELLIGANLPRGIVASSVLSPAGLPRFEIPMVCPVQYAPGPDLPIHPYVLGAILGDGSMGNRSVHLFTQRAIARRVAGFLPEGHTVRELPNSLKGDDAAGFTIRGIGRGRAGRNQVIHGLKDLGIYGMRAWEKRVPERYLRGTLDERRELLTGLMDTDGTVKLNGSAWFGTTSEGLARDVVEIVRSLGGLAHVRQETIRSYVYNGEQRNGRPAYLVCIELDGEPLVTLPHKVERWRAVRRRWSRRILSIEPIAVDERTCITVAAEDGLFVTEDYVVTHNSQAQRTKSQALLFVTKNRDASRTRPAIGDCLLLFRKPGDSEVPIPHTADGSLRPDDVSNDDWILWARPVWTGIRESRTLNARIAREENDEKHMTPLQLDFIERCVRLWSNPGELVVSPFAGVGSELYGARLLGRRAWGCELKPSYFQTAVRYLRELDDELAAPTLFDKDEDVSS